MYEADGELDRDWIRSLLAAGADGAVFGSASREQVIAVGRARLVRRRLAAGAALAVAAVVAATGYVVSDAGAYDGRGAVTASTAPAVRPVRQGPAIDTASGIGSASGIGTASGVGLSPSPSAF